MKKGTSRLLKEDNAYEYCFSDPLVEKAPWEVYLYRGSEDQ